MNNALTVTVSGKSASGKSTVATSIQHYLQTVGFTGVTIKLTDNEMPPCPTELRKQTAALVDANTHISVIEQQAR